MGIMENREHYQQSVERYSDAIKVSRVMCVFMVSYVHLYLFNSDMARGEALELMESLMRDLFARSSVPLLSVISGFLVVGLLSRRRFPRATLRRVQCIVVPFIVWNAIGVTTWVMRHGVADLQLINALFALTDHSFHPHLTFLRDVFVVFLLSPVLLYCIKNHPLIFLMFLLGFVSWVDLAPLILRDQILTYYVLGLYLAMYRLEGVFFARTLLWLAPLGMLGLIVATCLQSHYTAVSDIMAASYFDCVVRRPICALSFWWLALLLAKRRLVLKFVSNQIEPAIFLMFLSHALLGQVISSVYSKLYGFHSPSIYFAVWLLLPVACLILAMVGQRLLKLMPRVISLVLVGR